MNAEQLSVVALVEQLREAEDKMQDARYSGDTRAFGYAEGTALRIKRDLARYDENKLLTPGLQEFADTAMQNGRKSFARN